MTNASTSESNPLFRFRKPNWLAKRSGEAHFKTQREDVMNDTGMFNIYPSEFTYIVDPSLEVDLALWEEADNPESIKTFYKMTMREGYLVASADEWIVADRIAVAWKSDVAKRVVFSLGPSTKMVLMWRTGQKATESEDRLRATSKTVSQSAEEREAEMREGLSSLGASVKFSIDDDDDDQPREQRQKKGSR